MREFRVFLSDEDEGWIATVSDYPSLSAFAENPISALRELVDVVLPITDEELDV
jgi:predicted RNase H-like HicB family nuclease